MLRPFVTFEMTCLVTWFINRKPSQWDIRCPLLPAWAIVRMQSTQKTHIIIYQVICWPTFKLFIQCINLILWNNFIIKKIYINCNHSFHLATLPSCLILFKGLNSNDNRNSHVWVGVNFFTIFMNFFKRNHAIYGLFQSNYSGIRGFIL